MKNIRAVDIVANEPAGNRGIDEPPQGKHDFAVCIREQLGIGGQQNAQAVRHTALGRDIVDETLHPFGQRNVGRMIAHQVLGRGA
jgi:hypothetical protein